MSAVNGENRFVFVAPMYNASDTLARMLHSLYGQSYANWKLVLIDDVSDHRHQEKCDSIIQKFRMIDDSKVESHWNSLNGRGKCWEVSNVLFGISRCEDNDIVCRIDADDWLTDLDALSIINYAYNKSGCEILWTAHRWSYTDRNISGPLPENADPYKHQWVSSHLKTFRKYLLNDVNDLNFRGPDGEYIKRAGDQAIYLPALHNTHKRVFLPRVMYHYTIDEQDGAVYQTKDAVFQRDEAEFIRNRGYIK